MSQSCLAARVNNHRLQGTQYDTSDRNLPLKANKIKGLKANVSSLCGTGIIPCHQSCFSCNRFTCYGTRKLNSMKTIEPQNNDSYKSILNEVQGWLKQRGTHRSTLHWNFIFCVFNSCYCQTHFCAAFEREFGLWFCFVFRDDFFLLAI